MLHRRIHTGEKLSCENSYENVPIYFKFNLDNINVSFYVFKTMQVSEFQYEKY